MGSNPTARSGNDYGVVAKWQGKGLQNPDHGSKSRRRLSKLLKRAALFINDLIASCWEGGFDSGKVRRGQGNALVNHDVC
jgi:hypothetical protein